MNRAWADYNCTWANAVKDKSKGHASGGLLILTKKHYDVTLLESCDSWIFIHLRTDKFNLIIGAVYFNPKCKLKETLRTFRDALESLQLRFTDYPVFLVGDFNARVGQPERLPEESLYGTSLYADGKACDLELNSRGKRLVECMRDTGFILVNGRTLSDRPAQITYARHTKQNRLHKSKKKAKKTACSTIDLAWTNLTGANIIKDLEIKHVITFSDHFPAVLTLNETQTLEKDKNTTNIITQSLRWNENKSLEFTNRMQWAPEVGTIGVTKSVEVLNDDLSRAIRSAANSTGMIKKSTQRRNWIPKEPWFDHECFEMKKKASKKLKKYVQAKYDDTLGVEYGLALKEYKQVCVRKNRIYINNLIEGINNAKNAGEFWLAINKYKKRSFSQCEISKSEWENFYDNIYIPKAIRNNDFFGVGDPVLDREFSLEELETILNHSKNKKAAGRDDITNEFYKALPQNWKLYLLTMFNRVLAQEKIPSDWGATIMTMIFKKGEKKIRIIIGVSPL